MLALRRLGLVERRLVAVQGEPQQALHVRQQRAGGAQALGVALRQKAGRRRAAQHLGGMRVEQVGPRRGVAQRQVLGDEVDVEQAAGQVLEVPRALGRHVAGDAVAHVGDVAHQRRGIARPAERGPDDVRQPLDQARRSVDHARARQRHVLPGPGRLRMVALEALERIGERPGAAGRAQPHVDLVERALVGEGGERRHDLGAEPRVVLGRRQRLRAVRRLEAGRDVVDEDQVEVGGGRHLAAAELAHAQHRQALAAEAAMRLGEALLDPIAQRGDRGGGDVGVGEARLGRPHDRLELLHADLEAPVVGPAPRQVEDVLLVIDLGQWRGEIGRHLRRRGQRPVEVRRQHRIEQERAAREMGGKARRAAHDGGDQLEQRRVGLEQREELHAGRQVAEEEVEVQQRLVGRGGRAQRLQERRASARSGARARAPSRWRG